MLSNYFAAAVRNLFRNGVYSALNIGGLAIAFATTILIALFVRYEYSYDRSFSDHDRLFQLQATIAIPGRTPTTASVVQSKIADALRLDFSAIETTARLAFANVSLSHEATQGVRSTSFWADPDFFRLFPFRTVSGDLSTALDKSDGLVLTRSTAQRLFGSGDAIGKAVNLDGQHVLLVTAVIEDLPSNTNLQGDVFVAGLGASSDLRVWDTTSSKEGDLNNRNVFTYVRLRPDASVEEVNAALPRFVERHFPGEFAGVPVAKSMSLKLVPITQLHLGPPTIGAKPPGDARTVHTLIAIASLILLVGGFNFIGMMSARAAGRGVEVGVRKAVGATRFQIVTQFIGESLFYVGLALILAVVAVYWLMPAFNAFLQRDIAFDLLRDPALAIGLVSSAILVGIAAGAYPALVLSLFRPVDVLRGTLIQPERSGRLRQALVIFQFSTLIALTIITLTVHRQTQYATKDRLRLPGEEIYLKRGPCPSSFVNTVKTLPGVRDATCASGTALALSRIVNTMETPRGEKIEFVLAPVDYGFFGLFGITPLAGRTFAPEFGEDDVLRAGPNVSLNPTVVVNETGARALGFSSADSAVTQSVRWSRLIRTARGFQITEGDSSAIVGVVPDFPIGSARKAIEPTAYYIDPGMLDSMLILRLDGATIPEALRAVRATWERHTRSDSFGGTFLSRHLNNLYADIQRLSVIFSIFAGVAVVIAMLGLLGLAVFTAERRTREIGVRKVMGASRWDILRLLGWQFMRPVLWANLVAWPAAFFFMQRWLETFSYHIGQSPLVFVGASALALLIALTTVAGHSLRVARAKPVMALRYE